MLLCLNAQEKSVVLFFPALSPKSLYSPVLRNKSKPISTKKTDNIAYYTIPVDFEITGNFLGYIKFKRALSLSRKMLNFDKETIKVVKADTTGAIKVNGTLTIVGLAGENF